MDGLRVGTTPTVPLNGVIKDNGENMRAILLLAGNSVAVSAENSIWEFVITALISVFTAVLTAILTTRRLYADTVSASRMEWINIWRENIAEFLAQAEKLNQQRLCQNEVCNTLLAMNRARNRILVRLNLAEAYHREMYQLLMDFDNTTNQNFGKKKEELLSHTRKTLKLEWERYKNEAGGRK